MSKIQDALAKLKHSDAAPSKPIGRVEDTQRSRVLKPPADAYEQVAQGREEARTDREIVVERDSLRSRGFLVPDKETRVISEAFRRIKRPLINNMDAEHRDTIPLANVIAVASAKSGEGKTFTCINLALSIAQERDLHVLLVDGDLLKPELSQLLGAENEPGLMDLLVDSSRKISDVIMRTDIPGLMFLPAGHKRQLTTELLGSRRMDAVVSALSTFDRDRVVIFDTSPILLASDAVVLTGHAGQIAMVVKAGASPRQEVIQAIESLDKDKPLNLVLNQVRLTSESGEYGYYGQVKE